MVRKIFFVFFSLHFGIYNRGCRPICIPVLFKKRKDFFSVHSLLSRPSFLIYLKKKLKASSLRRKKELKNDLMTFKKTSRMMNYIISIITNKWNNIPFPVQVNILHWKKSYEWFFINCGEFILKKLLKATLQAFCLVLGSKALNQYFSRMNSSRTNIQ